MMSAAGAVSVGGFLNRAEVGVWNLSPAILLNPHMTRRLDHVG
jgi:hypothetical protein